MTTTKTTPRRPGKRSAGRPKAPPRTAFGAWMDSGGYSVKLLADVAGVGEHSIRAWRSGRQLPSITSARRLILFSRTGDGCGGCGRPLSGLSVESFFPSS